MKVNDKHGRFKDADWYGEPKEIIIGGAGGIGSWLTLFLCRIGHKIYLFDNDNFDEGNMAGQLVKNSQIGKNKAESMSQNVLDFCGESLVNTMGLFDDNSPANPIMFSAFDNMKARKLMFSKWKEQENREIFIDGRVQAETGMIFCVVKGQEIAYEAELFDDSEVKEAPCTFKATSHCGAHIATLMTAAFNNYLSNIKNGGDHRDIPFRLDFELPMMMWTTYKAVIPQTEEVKIEKQLENVKS